MSEKTVDMMLAMAVVGFVDLVVILAYAQSEGLLKLLLAICFIVLSVILVAGAYETKKGEK